MCKCKSVHNLTVYFLSVWDSILLSTIQSPKEAAGGRGSFLSAEQLEEEEEDVDHVHVDAQRSEHVLLRAQGVAAVSHQQLNVKGQELRKERGFKFRQRRGAAIGENRD